jgi:hypothetical protein
MDDDTRNTLDALTIRGQADLQRMWELLMQPLGFRRPSIWLTLIGPDRRPVKFLVEVDDLPATPSEDDTDALLGMLAELVADSAHGCSVALLVTRPGADGLTDLDRRLAAMLLASGRRFDVPCEPVHVASDVAVRAVAPDDLAA